MLFESSKALREAFDRRTRGLGLAYFLIRFCGIFVSVCSRVAPQDLFIERLSERQISSTAVTSQTIFSPNLMAH